MNVKKLMLLWGLLFGGLLGMAQEEEPAPISGGMMVGVHATQNGHGLDLVYLQGPDDRQWMFALDIRGLRGQREVRAKSPGNEQGRRYVYGKLNHLMLLNPSLGLLQDLFPRNDQNLINLRAGLRLGPAIGLISPYYLEVENPVPVGITVEAYDPERHTEANIVGRANLLSTRIDPEVKVGISLKSFLLLDFSRHSRGITALQLGFNADWFASPLPLLAERTTQAPNEQFFFGGSMGIVVGNRN